MTSVVVTIWNSSLVRTANRPFFFKHWAEAGVRNIKDLGNNALKVFEIEDTRCKRSGVFGQNLIAATKLTTLAYKPLIQKCYYPPEESSKMGKEL